MKTATKKSFKESIQALIDAGNDIERSECETHYIHTPTGQKLQRTTTWITGAKPFNMPEKWKGAGIIGTACDQLVRDYFVEGAQSIKRANYPELSDQAFTQLTSGIKSYDETFIKPGGWKVLADRVYLYSLELGVAGEVDLIIYNEDTEEIRIIDMKTVRSPHNTRFDKVAKYTRQLNTYKRMAEELTVRNIDGLDIMWIKVWYDAYDNQTSEAYIHKMESIPTINVLKEVEDIWMEEKGYHWSQHSETPEKREADDSIEDFITALLT